MATLPIAIVGAGPVGLAAAAELILRGEQPVVFEAGAGAGAAMSQWGHVRLFSPWRYCIAPAARVLLARHAWKEPAADDLPTAAELVAGYLSPLASTPELRDSLRLRSTVTAIARRGLDKLSSRNRAAAPFELRLTTGGREESFLARAVIDATGTWQGPNRLGSGGIPATGETVARNRISYRIPDVLGSERQRYLGRHTLVVGSGHSAFNVILDLIALRQAAPATQVSWAVRRGSPGQLFGGGAADALPARGALGSAVHSAVESGAIVLVTGFSTTGVRSTGEGLLLDSGQQVVGPFDEVIVATGFRPDLQLTSELRLDLDPLVEAPRALAPLIDPNLHSCGTVPPHGARQLAHPEIGYFAIGMKSYGRAPTFLMLTGYEQARSVAAELTGDHVAAERVELELPVTGVCSTPVSLPDFGGRQLAVLQGAVAVACCGGPAEPGQDACCAADAEVKAAGGAGCGCTSSG